MRKFYRFSVAAGFFACLVCPSPVLAQLTWYSLQTVGTCTPSEGCFSPDRLSPWLGTLRRTDVSTHTSFQDTYRFENETDQDASVTFLVTGNWSNWDSTGYAAAIETVFVPAFSVDYYSFGLSASEDHSIAGDGGYHDYGFDYYVPDWSYDITLLHETGDAVWNEERQYHYDGTRADVTLTYNYTTGSIPEPASWVMLIVGFGLIGGVTRRQRRRAASMNIASA